MDMFINAKEDIVTEAIDGLIACAGGRLRRLDGFPHIKVVLRTDWDKSKVAVVSGGGSGHEPAHAGFVGQGMLTAAVCGDVFASPPVDAVLAAILAVTGESGCLLIVKNYTGDRLNFGLAAERAKALGLRVEMIIVDDDIALPELPQPRGIAGTLFVHKVAGASAEAGESLETVAEAARRVKGKIASIGMSLSTCLVPGSEREDRIAAGKAELGLGIHGEPGVRQIDFSGSRAAAKTLLAQLDSRISGSDSVALINNLGSATDLEMSILAGDLLSSGRFRHVIGPAAMMTSLDMHGFSVSVLNPTDEELAALHAPVTVPGWPGLTGVGAVDAAPLPEALETPKFSPSRNAVVEELVLALAESLIESEKSLNALDAKSGDGDTGSTLASAMRALKRRIASLPLDDPAQLLTAVSVELGQLMGGSAGVILSIFFSAAGEASQKGAKIELSLLEGLRRVKEVGGAEPGDRTMIDALEPALEALSAGAASAAKAARAGADRTAGITQARAGRAAYVSAENLKGNNDPGAEAVALVFERFAQWSASS